MGPATGSITGTLDHAASSGGPAKDGIYPVTITARDPHGATATDTFTWHIQTLPPTATANTARVTEDNALTASGNLIRDDNGNGVDSLPEGVP